MNSSTSWHLSLPAPRSQVQHVLGEQCACHCEMAGGSVCARSCYTGSKVRSSDLTKLEQISPVYLAPQNVESEQNLKGAIPFSLLPWCQVDTRAFPGHVRRSARVLGCGSR